MPDQVHELAILSVPKGILVEYEGVEWRPIPFAKADISTLNSAPQMMFEEMENISSPSTSQIGYLLLASPPGFFFHPAPPWSVVALPSPWTSGLLSANCPSTPLSFQHPLGPQSHKLCFSPPAPWLHIGRSSPWLRLGLHELRCCIVSLDLHHYQLHLSQSTPGSACQVANMTPPSLDFAVGLHPIWCSCWGFRPGSSHLQLCIGSSLFQEVLFSFPHILHITPFCPSLLEFGY